MQGPRSRGVPSAASTCAAHPMLLSAGTRGRRFALPNAEIVIHQL
ncbi:ATP-dependent Clp protease proteolytic subunit [Streptomyces meridianus]|uniref:ATP-dependent Clp protease proteolytic subunit n=1 Tax=Streptomyces meridianus TaxID=2938945 RepID=A0ABT0X838_9ACTN|nr:ATP-dependent Clp protease proteolytic subunit [Streptomyces meridianus]MCM2578686.1 ATP-dependent Clp protease proteolytic subunit [Streptomyces meridianus]